MNIYFAPMEGLTGFVFRNAYQKYYGGIEKYFTPFITATQSRTLNHREKSDILPRNNEGVTLIPQILSKDADAFLRTANEISEMGYSTVNLNLGCPSMTVVSKGKGSGFLANPEELNRFLDKIYNEYKGRISIKTRIGKDSPEEARHLLEIFNQYPVEELIIHPRIQKDLYQNKPNLEVFAMMMENSKNPVCYNGDLCTKDEIKNFSNKFATVDTCMIGRGFLKNPGFLLEECLNLKKLYDFHNEIYEGYQRELSGERNVLFKMKELWSYLLTSFEHVEKESKELRKAEQFREYEAAVRSIFRG